MANEEAALDVLRDEGPGGNPFADLSQVIVTPHMAGGSRAAVEQTFYRWRSPTSRASCVANLRSTSSLCHQPLDSYVYACSDLGGFFVR